MDFNALSHAVLTDPEAAPEPAKRVNTLWDFKREESYSETFCPPPQRVPPPPLLSKDLQRDLESFFSPPKQKRVRHTCSYLSVFILFSVLAKLKGCF